MRSAACAACRLRKTKCTFEQNASAVCFACRSYGTACGFPASHSRRCVNKASSSLGRASSSRTPASSARHDPSTVGRSEDGCLTNPMRRSLGQNESNGTIAGCTGATSRTSGAGVGASTQPFLQSNIGDDGDDSGHRLIAPVFGSDSQAVSSLLGNGSSGHYIARTVFTGDPSGWSSPIVFTKTRKRPIGLSAGSEPAKRSLGFVEDTLRSWLPQLVDL